MRVRGDDGGGDGDDGDDDDVGLTNGWVRNI